MDEIDERTARERARWRTEASDSAAWDARALVSDLRKGERVQDAIAVGEEALAVFSAFEPLRSAVAWAYYDRDLKHLDETSAREARAMARNAVERIGQLTADDPYGRFSPWPRAVLRLAKVLQDRWPAAALEQLQRLDPTRLSSDSTRDYPSDAGRWRLSTTRVLENLAQWADLLEACDEALRSPGLREVDKTWLQLRRSTALTSLGRYADSIEVLLEFRKQSDPWWVNARLAEVYAAVDDAGTALAFARRALADGRDLDKKWKVVRRVERWLTGISNWHVICGSRQGGRSTESSRLMPSIGLWAIRTWRRSTRWALEGGGTMPLTRIGRPGSSPPTSTAAVPASFPPMTAHPTSTSPCHDLRTSRYHPSGPGSRSWSAGDSTRPRTAHQTRQQTSQSLAREEPDPRAVRDEIGNPNRGPRAHSRGSRRAPQCFQRFSAQGHRGCMR